MGSTRIQRTIAERRRVAQAGIAAELRRAIAAERVSQRAIGRAAGVDPGHLSRVLRGGASLSQDALVAIATSLGYDVSVRLFESIGPRIRDRLQAAMIEALLAVLHDRWLADLEIAVYRPSRGVIDLVLQDRATWDVVAGEAHSALATVEGQLRWAGQKADALPSASGWPWAPMPVEPRVGRLLLLRSCAANHDLVTSLARTFRAAYPDPTSAAIEALRAGTRPWPGAAIVWVHLDGRRTRVLDDAPRAVRAAGW